MTWWFFVGVAWGANELNMPAPPEPHPDECTTSMALTKGKPVSNRLVLDGVAVCSAVAEPTASLTYLLAVERYSIAAGRLHSSDVALLKAERDWYRVKYEAEAAPGPWFNRPATQRWMGRLETMAVVAMVGGGIVAIYRQGSLP